MLRRQAAEESESDVLTSQTSESTTSDPRTGSPTNSSSSSQKSGFRIPFRRKSGSPAREKEKEDALGRWLREGTVIFKSVGVGLMDLVVGMHLIKVAQEKQVGTHIANF